MILLESIRDQYTLNGRKGYPGQTLAFSLNAILSPMPTKSTIVAFVLTLSIIGPTFTASAATTKTASTSEFFTPAESEAKVRAYFKDIPVMIEIARCESKFRQFTDSGTVLRGGDSGGMIGVFQFFESIHSTPAKTLGFDLATLDGNLGYAKHVYTTEGTVPWNPAKACWDIAPAKTVTKSADKEKLRQQITLLLKLITLLQKQLDAKKLDSR